MAWRIAKSLVTLRKQVDAASPNRNKEADGTIGDASHKSRHSDHNPWVREGSIGVVTAMDITHDPAHGVNSEKLAQSLVASRDPRIKYVITNRKICSSTTRPWKWRRYGGRNPHNHHCHLSVKSAKSKRDNTALWQINLKPTSKQVSKPATPDRPVLRRGQSGTLVRKLQAKLHVGVDGRFGPVTQRAVKAFQRKKGLVADGVVGHYTWLKLEGER